MRCTVCLKNFHNPRFNTPRIKICGRCVNSLNEYREVAEKSQEEFSERLLVGMIRRAEREILGNFPEWRKEKANKTLENLKEEHANALPEWLNKMAADDSKTEKEYKILRAYRRGLLHYDRPQNWGYPNNWRDVATNIRKLDGFSCVVCGVTNVEIHVHHVIYASNFGTHRKENLVSLCKACHEEEHERELDFGEKEHNENSET